MKPRLHQFLLLLLAFVVLPSHAQEVLWEKSYGGLHADYLTDMQPTADYGFLIAGSSLSTSADSSNKSKNGNYDYSLWKIDENGNTDWHKNYGGKGNDMLQSIKNTIDGGFILAGTSLSSLTDGVGQKNEKSDKKDNCIGQADIWILKLDAQGNEMWQKTLGGLAEEQVATILQTRDHGYLICGSSESDKWSKPKSDNTSNTLYKNEDSKGGLDYWLIKLDAKGNMEWQKTIGGNYLDQLRSVVQTKDGGYFVAGITNSDAGLMKQKDNNGQTDIWYMKLDAKGAILWENTYGAIGDENVYSVLETQNGKLIVAGNTNSPTTPYGNNPEGSDFVLLNLDADGVFASEKLYNVGKDDILTNVIQNHDGTLLICGYSRQLSKINNKQEKGLEDYVMLKIDTEGNELWQNYYGNKGKEVLAKAIETRDGGYVLAGTSQSSSSASGGVGQIDFWVVKIKDSQKPEMVKTTIEAFPNPTIAFTNVIVGYDFESGTATLADLSGRQLQQFTIDSRTIPIDLSQYPEGIYIVNINTNNGNHGIKVIKKNKN